MYTRNHYETAESSSTSDCVKSNHSDQEVLMLASRNPKRRAGRKKFKETRHPVYRGIRKRNGGKWVCEMREPNKKNSRIWLGTFPSAEMAARAHDVAALVLRGSSACLNFADSVWRLPVPATASAKDIQKAAVEAAEIFRRSESEMSVESVGTSDENLMEESVEESQENVFYWDEDAVFGMPGLLVDMAEGLMVPPPPALNQWVGDEDGFIEDEVYLWSY